MRQVLAVLAAIAIGAVAGILIKRAGDEPKRLSTAPTTLVPLTGEAGRLFDSLAAGRKVTSHAKYRLGSASASGQLIEFELWRAGSDVRQDTVVSGPQAAKVSTFFHGDKVTSCSQPAGGSWTCTTAASGQLPAPDALATELTRRLAGVSVQATDEAVAGVASRCYDLAIPGEAPKVCVRADGVPTLIAFGDQRIELTSIDDTVSADVFVPPAPITTPKTTVPVTTSGGTK